MGNYHTCVRYRRFHYRPRPRPRPRPFFLRAYVVNKKINCWRRCHSRGGKCAKVCGKGGQCCRRGWKGCPTAMKNVATANYHTCVRYRRFHYRPRPRPRPFFLRAYVVNKKINCWRRCHSRGGKCAKVCRKGGQCCRRGWKGCPTAMKKVATPNYHTCVRYRRFHGRRPRPSRRGGCKITLYQHWKYGGKSNVYSHSMRTLKRNNDMSSLKVSKGCCVIIYDRKLWGLHNRVKTSKKFCKDTSFVGRGWNDKASSIKVTRS